MTAEDIAASPLQVKLFLFVSLFFSKKDPDGICQYKPPNSVDFCRHWQAQGLKMSIISCFSFGPVRPRRRENDNKVPDSACQRSSWRENWGGTANSLTVWCVTLTLRKATLLPAGGGGGAARRDAVFSTWDDDEKDFNCQLCSVLFLIIPNLRGHSFVEKGWYLSNNADATHLYLCTFFF